MAVAETWKHAWKPSRTFGYEGTERLTAPCSEDSLLMAALVNIGCNGWVHVERGTHLQDPFKDLAISRQYLRNAGF